MDDLPPFTDYDVSGRTYRYFQGQPLFPFGHGLSFTTFAYAHLHIDRQVVAPGDTVIISAVVSNSGDIAGDEVVQLYVQQQEGARLVKKLTGNRRIHLEPGESKRIAFRLHTKQLGHYDEEMRYLIPSQTVGVAIGRSSADCPLNGNFTVEGPALDATNEKVFFSDVFIRGE